MIFLYNVIKHVMGQGKVGEESLKMYDYPYVYMLPIAIDKDRFRIRRHFSS